MQIHKKVLFLLTGLFILFAQRIKDFKLIRTICEKFVENGCTTQLKVVIHMLSDTLNDIFSIYTSWTCQT